ncbi:MAG: phosphatidate cytidylyltransferase [Actinomycetota bacterium]|nr:phosphatidate cytidylyltransferase [Actinomycetota bacterium]
MTDDAWRRRRDEEEDFGPPLFADDSSSESGGISFGESDTGPLPHWTQPPTGELPRVLSNGASDPTDELDVWSSFSGQSPSWRDDRGSADPSGGLDDITGLSPVFEEPEPAPFEEPAPIGLGEAPPARREPGRITIGTDPTDGGSSRPGSAAARRPKASEGPQRGGRSGRSGSPARPGAPAKGGKPGKAGKPTGGTGGRDMPTAVAVGLAIAAIFIGAVKFKPWAVAVIVVLVLGLAAVEYFDRVREKGYQPAFVPGLAACVAAPTAMYFYGVSALPLVLVFTFIAVAVSFIGAPNLESNPMPNMAITSLGITWIGLMGSFGAAIVAASNSPIFVADGFFSNDVGTDTLTLLAIGVVANDVGALFVGSAVGKTPLRHWISPNKSIEGALGGTVLTLGAMFLVGVADKSTTWNSTGDLLLLGLVISIMAPIGDLTESMFKRNLDVKDFGSIVKGHGGVLDRFDGFLFVMPAAYYLLTYLQPWVS